MYGWVSPRLGIRFEVVNKELQVYHPDGERFANYVEVVERAERAESALETSEEALEQSQEALARERNRVQILLEQLRARGIDPSDLDLG